MLGVRHWRVQLTLLSLAFTLAIYQANKTLYGCKSFFLFGRMKKSTKLHGQTKWMRKNKDTGLLLLLSPLLQWHDDFFSSLFSNRFRSNLLGLILVPVADLILANIRFPNNAHSAVARMKCISNRNTIECNTTVISHFHRGSGRNKNMRIKC